MEEGLEKEQSETEKLRKLVKHSLRDRQMAYIDLFGDRKNKSVQIVLDDLKAFCRAMETTFHQDPRVHALAEGRREVFMRIADHINMDIEDLYERYSGVRNRRNK